MNAFVKYWFSGLLGFPYSQFFILWSEIVYDPASELASLNPRIRARHLSGFWYEADYGD